MNPIKTIFDTDETTLGKDAASWLIEQARIIAKTKSEVIIALPGGRSIAGLYRALSLSRDAVWKKIHIFLLDERAVPTSSPDNNYRLIRETLADALVGSGLLPAQNLHPLIVDEQASDYGAGQYSKALEAHGGAFDIVVLSAGEDGHIGALFPHHAALRSPKSYQSLNDSPKTPPRRITATPFILAHAQAALILFIGTSKEEAYRRFRNPHLTLTDCPAKIALEAKEIAIATTIPTHDINNSTNLSRNSP